MQAYKDIQPFTKQSSDEATASAGQLRNLLNWILKCVAWPFHTVG